MYFLLPHSGMFSTLEYTPIHFINRPVDQVELAALYSVADSVVVSSVRDGMNLVSHEYVDGRRRSRREIERVCVCVCVCVCV